MARYDAELLNTAERLLARDSNHRGKLARAWIRGGVSTSYYALFHFLLDELARP